MAFIAAPPLPVCPHKRSFEHTVFDGQAARGKRSIGSYFGFKVQLVVNDQGEWRSFMLTPGTVEDGALRPLRDRKPVPTLLKRRWGKLFGAKGYASQPLVEP